MGLHNEMWTINEKSTLHMLHDKHLKSLLVTTQMSFASHISIGIIVVVLVTVYSLVLRLV